MQKVSLFGLLLALLVAAPAAAQHTVEPVVSAPGVLPVLQTWQTTLGALPVFAGPRGEILDAAVPSVLSVAEAREARTPVGRYRLVGALAGAVLGMAGYYLTGYQDDYCRDTRLMSCDIGFAVYGAVGAAAGALAGHIVGTTVPPTYPAYDNQ